MKPSILDNIQFKLSEIERREEVKIIFACESGSRAWGFESADSDYDVRFIYLRPTKWYLSLSQKSDVIETTINDELDISGWDITKALVLLGKSNPALLEWLQSPIVYSEMDTITKQVRELIPDFFNPKSCMYHYLHLAQTSFTGYLKTEQKLVKKCFYALRAVLACNWIESGFGVVPTQFNILFDKLVKQPELKQAVEKMLLEKKDSSEKDMAEEAPIITNFLAHEIERLSPQNERPSLSSDYERLNQLF